MTLEVSIYGLNLHSNLPVPGLAMAAASKEPDVEVWLGFMPPWLAETLKGPKRVKYLSEYRDDSGTHSLVVQEIADGGYLHLRYFDGTEFVIDRLGTQIWGTWPETLTLEDTAVYLLGPVLGQVLGLRGITCLHASAIAFEDCAIGLTGSAGAGKSTTAAAFARLGYPVLSDDVLTLDETAGEFVVHPAYPLLRLWSPSVQALFGATDALPLLTPTWDKRYLELNKSEHRFQAEPLRLAAIYILGQRCDDPNSPIFSDISANEGLISLIGNSYAARYLDNASRGREFKLLGRLGSHVPLRLVKPDADIGKVFDLCRAILADFAALNLCPGVQTDILESQRV